ncbi:T9SS type B sorting domain-containing protein [Tenacibaculum sp. 1_MG-2023]|uniref:T9SS type B sorting domain-containing protein n=1 Tax=Tenacibaculum sp. 1_MG-2023 TaxID=3062653 RepID=UPI0026E15387|nr:T9SS type B sorting domain-containing protein [Tenacibaculum sp. 1_MG-2023]MDO6598689.1 T9SS type B sorting domain-containing protein [Tenacibaculum sp. 1_MG-2023]
MKKIFLSILFCFLFYFNSNSQITLSHNIGNTPIATDWVSCGDEDEYWARTFTLSDFGISTDEQFIIRSGQIAISNSYDGANLSIGIHIIDQNFPDSSSKFIGGGAVSTPIIGDSPETVQINFNTPVVVPSGVKRILVVAYQYDDIYNPDYKKVLIAGTEQDNDTSWFKGCRELYTYTPTGDLDTPVPNANFFINVTGEKRSIINSQDNAYLSHNIDDNLIQTSMPTCSLGSMKWARKFNLSDFGISENEEFIINSGDVGITGAGWLANVKFNIYEVDENFPSSFSENDLIGSSQKNIIYPFSWNSQSAKIITTDFDIPIKVPAHVKTILVEVSRGIEYGDGHLFVSGTENDNDESWFRGCPINTGNEYEKMSDVTTWGNEINFYITVYGEAKTIFPFEINNTNNCINSEIDFTLTNQSEVDTVVWNFNDPSSGINNTSNSIDVTHQFSNPGVYNVTAEVLHIDGTNYTIPKEIEIFDAPIVNPLVQLKQCDNSDINGFSFFNLTEVNEEIITNSTDYTITYFETEAQAQNDDTPITNFTAYENQTVSTDVVWARIENTDGCYRTSQIDLFVSTTEIPLTYTREFYECDDGTNTTDGIATFDFSQVTSEIENIFPIGQQLIIKYYQSEADALTEMNAIPDANISNYQNTASPNQQEIYIRVDSAVDNDCLGLGHHITLNVETQPVANPVTIDPECDNDRDGLFSFDTSTIQNTLIGTQTNVTVAYTDENGASLPSPLPNPFSTASQTITARVTNTSSQDSDGQCYAETTFDFVVNAVPIANPIAPQEQCDNDTDGIIAFDTSNIESTILGTQTGMIVTYVDENGTTLPSPLPNPFTTASQIITVRIENPIYAVCYEETTVAFIVREKPIVKVSPEDIICMTSSPSKDISVENPNLNYTYTWTDENGTQIGTGETITVNEGGMYSVIATSQFGCDSDEATITIIESEIATITQNDIQIVEDSDNNSIVINTANLGQGEYQFSLLDENSLIVYDYQDSPVFENLKGGIYTIEIRDKNDCGTVKEEVSVISYPKFITPNNDRINDVWTIKGFNATFYPSSTIYIYNRFGKIIAELSAENPTWNGLYNGKPVPSNEYWFTVQLIDRNGNLKTRKGHFSLLRK